MFRRLKRLIRSGINLLKYYLDGSKGEQIKRLEDRKVNPLSNGN